MDMSLFKPLSQLLDVSINEILSGEEIYSEELKCKADENIISLTELYDLKAIKNGTVTFTATLLFLLIYLSKKGMDTLPVIILWFVYNLSYFMNKYQWSKDKRQLWIAMLYGLGVLEVAILFFFQTF